jgi:probable HAF family extracellular repeat protein
MMRTLSSIAAVVALTSASIVSAAQFSVADLGGFGGSLASRGSSIGSTAMVGGTWYVNGSTPKAMTAVVAGGGTVTHVQYSGAPADTISYGMGIGGADGETLVGYSQMTSRGNSHAITGSGGVVTDLHGTIAGGGSPFAGADTSRGLAINADNTVVGQAKNGSGNFQAFTLSGSTVTAVPMIGGYSNSLATAINGHGLTVGFDYNGTWNYSIGSAISNGVSHAKAFSFDGTTMTSLNTLGGLDSIATAVNSAGVIVGQSTLLSTDVLDTKGHAFVYNGGTMSALAEAAGTTMSLANDINDNGEIVGTFRTAGFLNHAFLYRNGAMVDLNTLISGSGWVLTEATSINDDGYITGYGTHNGVQTAFLLSPVAGAAVPEPASLGLIGVGAAALVARRRRA